MRQVHQPAEALEHLHLQRDELGAVEGTAVNKFKRRLPGLIENLRIPREAGDTQRQLAMLPHPQHIPRTPLLEVDLGDAEAVRRLLQRMQAVHRILGSRFGEQEAVPLPGTAADAPRN